MKVTKKLPDLLRSLGPWGACLYAVQQGARRLGLPLKVYSYLVVAQPVADRPLLPASRGRDLVMREICAADAALAQMPWEKAKIADRFDHGARCFGLFRDTALVAYLWLQFGPYEEDEVRCRFEPRPEGSTVWDFDVYVRPDSRLSPAFLKLWDAVNASLRQAGIRYSLSRISAFNMVSLRSHQRLGACVLARTDFVTLGPLQVFVSSLRPRFHVSVHSRSRPVVAVDATDAEAKGSTSPNTASCRSPVL